MPEIYVLDTHVLIWYFIGSRRLKSPLLEKIDQVRNKGGRLLIPTIVLSEALDIAEKNRIKLDFPGMYERIQNEEEFEIIGFSIEIFEETRRIEKIIEIHGRIITPTARFYESGLMTKDRIIQESGEVETL